MPVTKDDIGKYVRTTTHYSKLPKGAVVVLQSIDESTREAIISESECVDFIDHLELFEFQRGDQVKLLAEDVNKLHEVTKCASCSGIPRIWLDGNSDSFSYYSIDQMEKVGNPNRVSAEPICTCESLLYGCSCAYSKWRQANKFQRTF